MRPELLEVIGEARTAALAANCTVTELLVYIEALKKEAEGWRRRNLIMDSHVERQEAVVRRLEAVAAAWEAQLAVIADLDRLDLQVKKLMTGIIREDADKKRDPWETVS